MTRIEANQLLDEIKNGINNYSNLAVTRALWVCGDLRGTPIPDLIASCQDGENTGFQASCLAQGERIGE
jgi:hypothetical protein